MTPIKSLVVHTPISNINNEKSLNIFKQARNFTSMSIKNSQKPKRKPGLIHYLMLQ